MESNLKISEQTARLFFALWPEPVVRRKLARLADQVVEMTQGRVTAQALLHLTLVFLGEVPLVKLPELRNCINLKNISFDFMLDTIGYWHDNRIVWLGARNKHPPILNLYGVLTKQLGDGGFQFDKHHYTPHITLVRNAIRPFPKIEIEPIVWNVKEVVLIQSKFSSNSIEYQIIERWSLK